jgi:hypothetical protein
MSTTIHLKPGEKIMFGSPASFQRAMDLGFPELVAKRDAERDLQDTIDRRLHELRVKQVRRMRELQRC